MKPLVFGAALLAKSRHVETVAKEPLGIGMDELEIRPVHGFLVVLVSEETHVMALTEVNNAVGNSYHVVDVMSGDVAFALRRVHPHNFFLGVAVGNVHHDSVGPKLLGAYPWLDEQ